MPNIEIKAICHDLSKARAIVENRNTEVIGKLHQVDTYYETKKGRLKLREINHENAQLIPYYKEYSTGPMKSNYSVLPVDDVENLKHILKHTLGELLIVDKKREVYLIDNIRVHLDAVKGLGTFIEFEAVYSENTQEAKEREVEKVDELIKIFQIDKKHLLDKSYIDYFLEDYLVTESIKVLYFFKNDSQILFEVENLDKKDDPPEVRFFWFLYNVNDQNLEKLSFKSMSSDDSYQYRKLSDLDVRFNSLEASISRGNESINFRKSHPMLMDFDLKNELINFFK